MKTFRNGATLLTQDGDSASIQLFTDKIVPDNAATDITSSITDPMEFIPGINGQKGRLIITVAPIDLSSL